MNTDESYLELPDRLPECVEVECIEADIAKSDVVHVSYATGHEGKVTKSATNATPIARACFDGPVITHPDGKTTVRVRLKPDKSR